MIELKTAGVALVMDLIVELLRALRKRFILGGDW